MSILKPKGNKKIMAMQAKTKTPIDQIGPGGQAEVFRKLPVNVPLVRRRMGGIRIE